MMPEDEYDLAGFTVGVVDKEKILSNETMQAGDVILALPSTGVHSNGFSLVRKIFDIDNDPDVLHTTPAELGGKTLGDALLAPTKIYVKPVLKVLEEVDVKGISHITGGGFYENIPRSLKKGCCARIKKEDVRTPALFHLMQETGHISEHDMFNTFNMGVGMVLTVPAAQADKALEILHANGEPEAYSWVSSLKGTVWNCAERSCVGFRRRHQSAGPAGQRSPGREPQREDHAGRGLQARCLRAGAGRKGRCGGRCGPPQGLREQ